MLIKARSANGGQTKLRVGLQAEKRAYGDHAKAEVDESYMPPTASTVPRREDARAICEVQVEIVCTIGHILPYR